MNYLCIFPNATGVVLRSCDDGVAFIVESARENLVFMAVQHLQFVSGIGRPDPAGLVAAGSDDFVALRVELYFTDFIIVALQQSDARSCKHIIDPC